MIIKCKVFHPDHPGVEVMASCKLDAVMQAAHMWDEDWQDIMPQAKVTAKKSDIDKAMREREACQMSIGGV